MKDLQFGPLQFRILQVLWEKKQANAREITDILNQDSSVAHSTVQTLLRQLEDKGAISHSAQSRTFIFYPLVKEEKVAQTATRELVDRLFSGSPGGLMAYLLKQESIPRKELEKIKELIAEKECRS